MDKYIDMEAVLKTLEELRVDYLDSQNLKKDDEVFAALMRAYARVVGNCINRVKAVPVADYRPVNIGRWVKQSSDPLDGHYYCSVCHRGIDIAGGEETPTDRCLFFCPRCGAAMAHVYGGGVKW